ncbi:uncharacterized protein (TIGR00299 family) protein [Sinorhizobium kostiense]|uniref:Uncharacterized protein (TIGR00299 family) protein n=2 Tax=Sinorhizobium/Ensifer group TaxID=227292 RepID=A0ABS4R0W7_9HYPH|nr:uncharacterized protein (TIGR00299 family) protein [Sinorhizobium kostiense]
MFVAAMLDAWPEFAGTVQENLRIAGLESDVRAEMLPHDDGVLTGHRFDVTKSTSEPVGDADDRRSEHSRDHHAHEHDHHHHDHGHHHHVHSQDHDHRHDRHGHDHTHWRELRAKLAASGIPENVKSTAIGIFQELAEAEAAVHGKKVEDVAFHEVGNWDSIADIVAAATMIDAVHPESWSVGSLPLGRGFVETAHGRLPVPAPATTLLLRGFAFHDDGRHGERITPTGAAILRFLKPATSIGHRPQVLDRTGTGFGTRRFPAMSNVLRVLAFTPEAAEQDQVGIIQFEIDDQTGEELAVGIDRIRTTEGVIDVTQTPTFGKKGRMMTAIQVLTRPEAMDAITAQCFRQTTTLGLRSRVETRVILPRQAVKTENGVRVKIAERPGGPTAKAEMDDVRSLDDSHKARAELRRDAEEQALEAKK